MREEGELFQMRAEEVVSFIDYSNPFRFSLDILFL